MLALDGIYYIHSSSSFYCSSWRPGSQERDIFVKCLVPYILLVVCIYVYIYIYIILARVWRFVPQPLSRDEFERHRNSHNIISMVLHSYAKERI